MTRPAQARPNILVIEADDMRVDELRWMPRTRQLLLERGLDFKNSFAPYPLCCPSRTSFLTGKYTHNHHVYSHEDPYGFRVFDDSTTIATALQGSGYRTALVGKYLNGYGEQRLRGNHRSSLKYVPPGWTDWYGSSDHLWQPGDRFRGGTYDYFNLVQNINGRIVGFPGQYTTDVTGQQTRELIGKYSKQAQPWFVWWTPVAPHHGDPIEPDDPGSVRRDDGGYTHFVTPARPHRLQGRFDRAITHGLGLPPNRPAEADVSDKPRYLHVPPANEAEKTAIRTVSRQRAEALSVLDQQIGRTVSGLRRQGFLGSTVIIFTSDNGYYLGEHRKRQGKITLHEPALRVPLIITGPGITQGDRYDPVSTVDLAPTIATYAAATLPGVDGMPLQDLINNGDTGWNRAIVTETLIPEDRYTSTHHGLGRQPLNTQGIRLGQWKLTRYSVRHEKELYDLQADPLELTSQHRNPAYKKVLSELIQLQKSYANCAGPTCLAPIPQKFRLTPQQVRQITDSQIARTRTYYRSR
ncbi:MAG TPA: sulfatase [Marmoricola sp.]|nr:sulfatase [Marmoricola sp.]